MPIYIAVAVATAGKAGPRHVGHTCTHTDIPALPYWPGSTTGLHAKPQSTDRAEPKDNDQVGHTVVEPKLLVATLPCGAETKT